MRFYFLKYAMFKLHRFLASVRMICSSMAIYSITSAIFISPLSSSFTTADRSIPFVLKKYVQSNSFVWSDIELFLESHHQSACFLERLLSNTIFFRSLFFFHRGNTLRASISKILNSYTMLYLGIVPKVSFGNYMCVFSYNRWWGIFCWIHFCQYFGHG